MGQVQPQHDIAGLQDGEIHGRVGLGPGMRLHVDVLRAEELFCPVSGQVLGDIDELAAAVISFAGITFGIFIRKHAAHGLHNGGRGVVFAGDHFQAVPLAIHFAGDGGPKFGVLAFEIVHGRDFVFDWKNYGNGW